MYWLSIIYFFLVTLLTGALVDLFVRDWRADQVEKLVMRFGVGLAAMSVIGVILNLLHIPLDYRIFLGIGVLIALAALAANRRKLSCGSWRPSPAGCWKNRSFWYALVVAVLFAVTVNMYVGGAFTYDYLEDTDPWGYTAVSDYIGENRTFTAPYYSVQYNEPYTQGYQIVMGVLSQTNPSTYWTMKFFSALIVSFGVPFMYYFIRRFSGNEEMALLSAIFLFAVPAWTTHFVFSLHFNMTIFVVLLYVLAHLTAAFREEIEPTERLETGPEEGDAGQAPWNLRNGWMAVGMIVCASMFVNHFSTVVHASIFGLVMVVTRTLAEKRIDWKTIAVFPGGFLLSLSFFIPAYARHWWVTSTNLQLGGIGELFSVKPYVTSPVGMAIGGLVLAGVVFVGLKRRGWQPRVERWLEVPGRGLALWLGGAALVLVVLAQPYDILRFSGTATFPYKVEHFFKATSANLMNNPIGLGFLLMAAVLGSFLLASARVRTLFQPGNSWVAAAYGWIITAFALVLGVYASITIVPFRAWTFLGFFASFFAAWGIVTFVRMFADNRWVLWGTIALVAVVLVPTTFMPKYENNTKVWKSIVSGLPESQALFAWMREGGIPKNSVVAHLCGNSEFLSGYDMNPPLWDREFHPPLGKDKPYFVENPLILTREAYRVLKNAGAQYVTFGPSCYGQTPKNERLALQPVLHQATRDALRDRRLEAVRNVGGEFLFRLN